MGYNWGWYVVSPWSEKGQTNLAFLLSGLGWTVGLALCAIVASVVLGLLVALLGLARGRVARSVNRIYVESLRAVPMLGRLRWWFNGLPGGLGSNLPGSSPGAFPLA